MNRQPSILERVENALRRAGAAGVLHSQAVARRVGLSSVDLECLDLILMGGPATAGEIGRRTRLTSGAVTGLIDRLEQRGLVERTADPQDRRKVLVRVRPDAIASIGPLFAPLQREMQALLSTFSEDQLMMIASFAEQATERTLARVAELEQSATDSAVAPPSPREAEGRD